MSHSRGLGVFCRSSLGPNQRPQVGWGQGWGPSSEPRTPIRVRPREGQRARKRSRGTLGHTGQACAQPAEAPALGLSPGSSGLVTVWMQPGSHGKIFPGESSRSMSFKAPSTFSDGTPSP